jgi:muramoyltetrapeptide carboxypeptidase
VRFEPGIIARSGFLAGTDERRAQELDRALGCPETRAVIAARGGYGCTRMVGLVDFTPLYRHPKWLVGFSDVTALHLELQRRGFRSLHAHNATGLGRGDAVEREHWLEPLLCERAPRRFKLTPLYPGSASGLLWGGNLSVLCAALASRRVALPQAGSVLLLEDVGEAPYRIDRLLVQLEHHGVFDRCSGVVSGYFTPVRGDGERTRLVLKESAERIKVPWLHGLPCGHERPNVPIELGAWATLSEDTLQLD